MIKRIALSTVLATTVSFSSPPQAKADPVTTIAAIGVGILVAGACASLLDLSYQVGKDVVTDASDALKERIRTGKAIGTSATNLELTKSLLVEAINALPSDRFEYRISYDRALLRNIEHSPRQMARVMRSLGTFDSAAAYAGAVAREDMAKPITVHRALHEEGVEAILDVEQWPLVVTPKGRDGRRLENSRALGLYIDPYMINETPWNDGDALLTNNALFVGFTNQIPSPFLNLSPMEVMGWDGRWQFQKSVERSFAEAGLSNEIKIEVAEITGRISGRYIRGTKKGLVYRVIGAGSVDEYVRANLILFREAAEALARSGNLSYVPDKSGESRRSSGRRMVPR